MSLYLVMLLHDLPEVQY